MSLEMDQEVVLEEVYADILSERNDVAEIHQAYASFPQGMQAHYQFYKKVILSQFGPLQRGEREYLAVKTSEFNACRYCIEHHSEALRKFEVPLNLERMKFYEDLVEVITITPWKASPFKERALEVGLSEAEYSHAVMIISYFNMANRLAFAQGIKLEENFKITSQ